MYMDIIIDTIDVSPTYYIYTKKCPQEQFCGWDERDEQVQQTVCAVNKPTYLR